MNWKQWKLGLFVAVLTGLASGLVGALAGLAVGLTRQQIYILFAVNLGVAIGKDLLLFLQQHPADQVNFDTVHTTKTQTVETTVKTPSVGTDGKAGS
jgi:hypothetical protein